MRSSSGICLQGSSSSFIAPVGALDTAFGTLGFTYDNIPSLVESSGSNSISLQSDGKIIVTTSQNLGNVNYLLARYSAEGILDTTFGTAGLTNTDMGGFDLMNGATVLTNQKIVGVGYFNTVDAYVTRYLSNGSLDTSFGVAGLRAVDFNGGDQGRTLAIQSDGKIVIGGRNGISEVAVARLESDGTLDTTFGTAGKTQVTYPTQGGTARKILINSTGEIFACSSVGPSPANAAHGVLKLTSNGIVDTTYGTAGYAAYDITGGDDNLRNCTMQSDGKIITMGSSWGFDQALVRFTANGILDSTFNGTGYALLDIAGQNDIGSDVLYQPDGKIITVGCTSVAGTQYILLARYLSNGTLDTTFGTGGTYYTNFGIAGSTFVNGSATCTVSSLQKHMVK